jgi:hypothetical protein
VNYTVDLDHELGAWTIKVGNIWTNRVLPAKSHASWRAPKQCP